MFPDRRFLVDKRIITKLSLNRPLKESLIKHKEKFLPDLKIKRILIYGSLCGPRFRAATRKLYPFRHVRHQLSKSTISLYPRFLQVFVKLLYECVQ